VKRNGGDAWMFLDVFEEGPAHTAGIRPGDVLLSVDGVRQAPPSMPTLGIGVSHRLVVSNFLRQQERELDIAVPHRKGTKQRPPMVEPKTLKHSIIVPGIGLLRVTYFPGAFGMRFAKALDAAIQDLKDRGCDRLIIDLRGNIGGSLGFARLASYMCPGRVPIGHSLTPARRRKGYVLDELARVPCRPPRPVSCSPLDVLRFAINPSCC
jgi:C-terminal processing protease CtpA/Prc